MRLPFELGMFCTKYKVLITYTIVKKISCIDIINNKQDKQLKSLTTYWVFYKRVDGGADVVGQYDFFKV